MHRFYVAQKPVGDSVTISDAEQLHHLREVLRLKVNDAVMVFDSEGNEYYCQITRLTKKQAELGIKTKSPPAGKKWHITVACALPKNTRMEDIVDKLTQLGVDAIIPMETERVIVRLEADKKAARLQRWRKIARGAAQQSQRSNLPRIEPITDIKDIIVRATDFDFRLIPTLFGEARRIHEVLARARPGNILVLIGPEGDFTPQEVALAQSAGFIPVSLGETVLRVDTAAIAVVSYLRLHYG